MQIRRILLGLSIAASPTTGCQLVLGLSEHELGAVEGIAGAGQAGSSQTWRSSGGAGGVSGSGTAGAKGVYSLGVHEFCDDFETSNLSRWVVVDQDSTWRATWGITAQTNATGAESLIASQTSATHGYHYLVGPAPNGGTLGDQIVTAWVRPDTLPGDDNTKVGVCARVSGDKNDTLAGYCLFLRNDSATTGRIQIAKKLAGGSMTSLDAITMPASPFKVGDWHQIALSCSGSLITTLTGYSDGQPLLSVTDVILPVMTGQAAVVTRTASDTAPAGLASFDDVTLDSP